MTTLVVVCAHYVFVNNEICEKFLKNMMNKIICIIFCESCYKKKFFLVIILFRKKEGLGRGEIFVEKLWIEIKNYENCSFLEK